MRRPKYRRITALSALKRLEQLAKVDQHSVGEWVIPKWLLDHVMDDYRQHVQSYLSKGKR